MFVTNLTVLAVKLKKLFGTDCNADLISERTVAVHFDQVSSARSGTIDANVDDNGVCNVNMVVCYTIQQEEIQETAVKLRDGDSINVRFNGASVRRKYCMKINKFKDLSIEQVEHAAEDIVGTMQGL